MGTFPYTQPRAPSGHVLLMRSEDMDVLLGFTHGSSVVLGANSLEQEAGRPAMFDPSPSTAWASGQLLISRKVYCSGSVPLEYFSPPSTQAS